MWIKCCIHIFFADFRSVSYPFISNWYCEWWVSTFSRSRVGLGRMIRVASWLDLRKIYIKHSHHKRYKIVYCCHRLKNTIKLTRSRDITAYNCALCPFTHVFCLRLCFPRINLSDKNGILFLFQVQAHAWHT